MIQQLESLINKAYQIDPRKDGNYLILEEPENDGKANTLKSAKVNIDSIKSFAAYKFDQIITIKGKSKDKNEETIQLETYAPFLSESKGTRAMCDFIIFYNLEGEPDIIHAWIVNLKSREVGNSVNQMNAGLRLATFLVNKLADVEKSHDAQKRLFLGEVNFILFSLSDANKSGIGPAKSVKTRQPIPGTDPAHPCHYGRKRAPRIGPIPNK